MQEEKKKRERKKLTVRTKLLIGISCCLVLLVASWFLGQRFEPVRNALNYVAQPIQKVYVSVGNWFQDVFDNFQSRDALEQENSRLQEELTRLQNENLQLQNDARRVEELEELYELDSYYRDYPKTGAQIISLSPNNWYESFIIDKGSADGIEEYMPVLAGGGLAGHVSEVYEHYSYVVSVIHESSYIYGQINRKNGDLVAVQGTRTNQASQTETGYEELCMIQFVTNDVDITVGDEIVTSALGDIYPPGLHIGTVVDIQPLETGYESVAYVRPEVDLEQMDTMLVITEIWKQDMHDEVQEGGAESGAVS